MRFIILNVDATIRNSQDDIADRRKDRPQRQRSHLGPGGAHWDGRQTTPRSDALGHIASKIMGSSQIAPDKTHLAMNGAFENDLPVACAELTLNG